MIASNMRVVQGAEGPSPTDLEKHVERQSPSSPPTMDNVKTSTFKSLGWLDRFLVVWIFLAMLVGILLGNFVPSTGPALQRGTFVGVSVPIGKDLVFAHSRREYSQCFPKPSDC